MLCTCTKLHTFSLKEEEEKNVWDQNTKSEILAPVHNKKYKERDQKKKKIFFFFTLTLLLWNRVRVHAGMGKRNLAYSLKASYYLYIFLILLPPLESFFYLFPFSPLRSLHLVVMLPLLLFFFLVFTHPFLSPSNLFLFLRFFSNGVFGSTMETRVRRRPRRNKCFDFSSQKH